MPLRLEGIATFLTFRPCADDIGALRRSRRFDGLSPPFLAPIRSIDLASCFVRGRGRAAGGAVDRRSLNEPPNFARPFSFFRSPGASIGRAFLLLGGRWIRSDISSRFI